MGGKTILQRCRACGKRRFTRQKTTHASRLNSMKARAIILKTFRATLALCVALWMAGAGCLWGCSNTTYAATSNHAHAEESETVVAGSSCHKPKHDCCSKVSGASASQAPDSLVNPFIAALPEGMMKDCPLAMSATAVTSKNTNDIQSADRAATKVIAAFKLESIRVTPHLVPQHFLNRGPTYLRCCTFLI